MFWLGWEVLMWRFERGGWARQTAFVGLLRPVLCLRILQTLCCTSMWRNSHFSAPLKKLKIKKLKRQLSDFFNAKMSLCASLTDTGVQQNLLLVASTAELLHSTLSEITLSAGAFPESKELSWALQLGLYTFCHMWKRHLRRSCGQLGKGSSWTPLSSPAVGACTWLEARGELPLSHCL